MKKKLIYALNIGLIGYLAYKSHRESIKAKDTTIESKKELTKEDYNDFGEKLSELTSKMKKMQEKVEDLRNY